MFWTFSLKYTYSKDLLNPINEAFSGVFVHLKNRLKLGKIKTKDEDPNKLPGGVIPLPKTPRIQPNHPNNQIEINIRKDQNEVDIRSKKQSEVKIKKEYDSIQIDFEDKEQPNYVISNNKMK